MGHRERNNPPSAGRGAEVFFGIGSNLGDRREMFRRALAEMFRIPQTHFVALSPLYYTDPVDGAGPEEFLNGVARLDTTLGPLELLGYIEIIEAMLGRKTKGDYGPRTIDLDILLFGDRVVDSARLVIPHPRMTERAFVLRPLDDLAPDFTVPPDGPTVAEFWRRLADKSGVRPATDIKITDVLPTPPSVKAD